MTKKRPPIVCCCKKACSENDDGMRRKCSSKKAPASNTCSRGRSCTAGFTSDVSMETEDGYPLKMGSIIYCRFAGLWKHSGVYVGRGKIIHLVNDKDNSDGYIAKTGVWEFKNRLDGYNLADSIYVACDMKGRPLGEVAIAKEAMWHYRYNSERDYNAIFRNCHHFTGECIRGFEVHIEEADLWERIKSVADLTLGFSWLEENVIAEKFGEFQWKECW